VICHLFGGKALDNLAYSDNKMRRSVFYGTFKSGGVQTDAIRNITGSCKVTYTHVGTLAGAFYSPNMENSINGDNGNNAVPCGIGLDASRVVPTAVDNRVRALSERWWRRVA
jgi:hypothetical protein